MLSLVSQRVPATGRVLLHVRSSVSCGAVTGRPPSERAQFLKAGGRHARRPVRQKGGVGSGSVGGGERLAIPCFRGCQIHHCLLHARMMCKYLATAWSMGNFLENPVKSANLFCLGSRRREDPDPSGAGEWERYLPIWENYFPPTRGSRPAAGGVFAPVPASSLAAAGGARLSAGILIPGRPASPGRSPGNRVLRASTGRDESITR